MPRYGMLRMMLSQKRCQVRLFEKTGFIETLRRRSTYSAKQACLFSPCHRSTHSPYDHCLRVWSLNVFALWQKLDKIRWGDDLDGSGGRRRGGASDDVLRDREHGHLTRALALLYPHTPAPSRARCRPPASSLSLSSP
jgi:hypothetical protein